jgi:outer membrane lipoprotein-sorting protein
LCRGADLQEIVRKATATLDSDWARDPDYAYVERDETRKGESRTSRTSQVVMMAGSDYYLPLATNDQPLSPDWRKSELQKLKNEFQRRNAEDAAARQRRIDKYKKAREENGALLLDFPKAFTFEVVREESMNGFPAYVLSATPLKRTGPLSHAAKVLAGMQGTVWIDKENFHAIRGECYVVSPVPIYGILARVLPGTRVEIETAPVTQSTWLISKLSLSLTVSKFFWFQSTQVTISTYSDYRLNSEVLQELLAKADGP